MLPELTIALLITYVIVITLLIDIVISRGVSASLLTRSGKQILHFIYKRSRKVRAFVPNVSTSFGVGVLYWILLFIIQMLTFVLVWIIFRAIS
jgi:hypothetical protein